MNPVFVAIDTPDLGRAQELAASLAGHVGGVKLGLEFFCANGPAGVREVASTGVPVFLDLKLHDIPNTVAGAMRSLASLQPAVITVHAAGGRAMMEAAKEAAPAETRVVAVTVLTSLDASDLQSTGVSASPAEQVEQLASLALQSGLDGIVCSGAEVKTARAAWPEGFFVVPGIRPQGAATADQKRVVTPSEAIADGASILVIGRPITEAPDPAAAAIEVARSLGS
jgi:orotidine-5'-phosphate decarboxylase